MTTNAWQEKRRGTELAYAGVTIDTDGKLTKKVVFHTFFSDFIANFGGLAMIRKLYGETKESARSRSQMNHAGDVIDEEAAKKAFEEHVKSRQEFSSNYLSYLFYTGFLNSICCCLQGLCLRNSYFETKINRYQKFEIALQRLTQEQDIQYMIEMNRISRLLHKASLIVRQRRAIDYSHRFIINDANLRAEQAKQAAGKADSDLRTQELLDPAFVDKLLENFDPGSDLQDRRILYEVTG
eukprot:CAMPEP_0170465654 /NCGR_PEP_ID=MMETSP0123-20130129/9919_1 /TAXON_ID=182087 /ORGANISM="Favella ehrenbergii, Strain Fehren 1" /LENGTH=238 /DNA_ID=CAMNT_0010731609 /DNA_START=842 /DNA_END=1558 /DNA_ORIENTATION=+